MKPWASAIIVPLMILGSLIWLTWLIYIGA
jgi:hypothetical protein